MNKLTLFTAAAAFVALLTLFYAPPLAGVFPILHDGVIKYVSLPYVEGPGWYWLDVFWFYYNETIYCKPCPPNNLWCDTECEVTHILYPEVLSSVISGTCDGFTVIDFRVDDTKNVYQDSIIYPFSWWFYTFCQEQRELYPMCYPYAALTHKWIIDVSKQMSIDGKVYTLVYVDQDLDGIVFYRIKVKKESWPRSNVLYNAPTLVSTKNLTLILTAGQWWVYTPSRETFSMPYSPVPIAIVDHGNYLDYPRDTFYWLVYVPEGCRLYLPYPTSYRLTVVAPR